MEFREWLLFLESQTVSQYLYQQQHLPVKEIKAAVTQGLQSMPFFKEGRGTNQKVLQAFAKWFAYMWIQARYKNLTHREQQIMQQQFPPGQQKTPEITQREKDYWLMLMKPDAAASYVQQRWNEWGAFFSQRIDDNTLMSKLNNTDYGHDQVNQDVQDWHEAIARRKRGAASDDYEVMIKLDHLGGNFKGWYWADLKRGECSAEAAAMGHCGNVGQASENDNILSLRDKENYAHLTFIINDGILGEMKGAANSKPKQAYHPAIVELLKHPAVQCIRGGGHDPDNNFQFDDLNEQQQKEIKALKPYIDNWVEYAIANNKTDALSDILHSPMMQYNEAEGTFTLNTYKNPVDLNVLFKQDIEPYVGEDAWQTFESDYTPGWSGIHYHVDDEIEAEMFKYAEAHWDELDDDVREELDTEGAEAEDLYDNFEELKQAIDWAYSDASRAGAEGEAWKQFKRTVEEGNEDGFYIDFDKHPYELKIAKSSLSHFLNNSNQERLDYHEDIESFIHDEQPLEFEPPYNGYTDFDEDTFKEMVKERIAEIE